jgi:hypothetical protein
MLIIGCDFHSRSQQIAMMDYGTGEVIERRLQHEEGEARAFYADRPAPRSGRLRASRPASERCVVSQWHAS